MELDGVSAKIPRAKHGIHIRIDEEAATDPGCPQPLDGAGKTVRLAGDIKTALGRDFLAPLRHDRRLARAKSFSQLDDRVAERHLQVQRRPDAAGQAFDVGVLHMAPIFAKVGSNPISASIFAEERRGKRIRFVGAARLTNGGDMIDVDEQTLVRGVHCSGGGAVWRTPPVDPPAGRHYVRIQTALEPSVRKWALLIVVAAACARTPSMGSSLTGAPTAREAATMFVGAAQAQDLQAMGAVWGTDKGAARDNMERDVLDRRLIILQPCYTHDRAQVLDEQIGAAATERRVRIQLTRANRTKTLEFKVVRGPSNRWYVEDANYEAVQSDFCRPS